MNHPLAAPSVTLHDLIERANDIETTKVSKKHWDVGVVEGFVLGEKVDQAKSTKVIVLGY